MSDGIDYGKLAGAAANKRLRGEILQIAASSPTGELGTKLIISALSQSGAGAGAAAVNAAVAYLKDKGYVKQRRLLGAKAAGIFGEIISVTADGVDLLEGTLACDGVDL